MNGYILNGSKIIVEEARPKDIEDESVLLSHPRLYVGKLNENIKKQDVITAFSVYGDIQDILMKDDFAFVEFANLQSAAKALLEMNGAKLGGSKIMVEEAKPRDGEILPKRSLGVMRSAMTKNSNAILRNRTMFRRRKSPNRSISRSRSRSFERESFR